jgi:hypothetical protein
LNPLNAANFLTSLVTQQKPANMSGTSSPTSLASGTTSASPFSNLNLTPTEQTQISAILKSSQGQSFAQIANSIENVLTPAQKQTFASDLQGLQSSGGHHHHHGGGGSGASTIDSGTDAFGVSSLAASSPTTASAASASSSLFSDLAAMFSAQSQTQTQSQVLGL